MATLKYCSVLLALASAATLAQQPVELEGSIVMQVEGGERMTLTEGQTFYEGPEDVHTVGRNASDTEPASFLVLLVKDEGSPPLLPVE